MFFFAVSKHVPSSKRPSATNSVIVVMNSIRASQAQTRHKHSVKFGSALAVEGEQVASPTTLPRSTGIALLTTETSRHAGKESGLQDSSKLQLTQPTFLLHTGRPKRRAQLN